MLIFLALMIKFDHLDARLMSPLALPLIYVLIYAFNLIFAKINIENKYYIALLKVFGIVFFVFWFGAPNSLTDFIFSVS